MWEMFNTIAQELLPVQQGERGYGSVLHISDRRGRDHC